MNLSCFPKKVSFPNIDLYLGDCLQLLADLPKYDAIITDPPLWHKMGL